MKEKKLSAGIASLLITLILFSAIIGSAATEIPPPVSGIEILEYKDSIKQQAGTSETYEVKIKNIGVLSLRDVKLEAEKIQEGWFSSDGGIDLEFEEVGALKYKLNVPEDVSGLYWFSLIARGSYGVGTASDTAPVILNIGGLSEPGATPTTTAETAGTGTTQPAGARPPIFSISEELPKLIKGLKSVDPEVVFSKFRAAVTLVRTTAKDVLTNEMLIYKTVFVLFVVMVILVAGRKLIMS